MQELVLAKKATFICSGCGLSWAVIAAAWQNLSRHMRVCCTECVFGLPADDWENLCYIAQKILDLANARTGLEQGQHLVQTLIHFSWKQASDPRDKLYGSLGVQSSRTPTLVVPDYMLSLQQLFLRFATHMLRTQDWLIPLAWISRTTSPTYRHGCQAGVGARELLLHT